MSLILLGLGLVLVIEGLVLALAPSRIEDLLRALAAMPEDTRKLLGMLAITGGGILLTLAYMLAG